MRPMLSLLSVIFVALFVGCGTPSLESQVSRFKKNIDQVDVLATKQPALKADIEKKRAEFTKEFEAGQAKGGEVGAKELWALNGRVETWLQSLQGTAGAPGAPANTVPGNKLGGPANGAPAGGPAPGAAGGSGFGGPGANPAPTPVPAPQPSGKLGGGTAAQPAGGSGFGGGAAPAPAPTPAPPPAPAPAPTGGSGFGGK